MLALLARPVTFAGALVGALAGALTAQANEPRGKPDLEVWQVGGEVIAGAYAGYAGYFTGRFVGSALGEAVLRGADRETARRRIRVGFGYLGGAFGVTGAVYGVGSLRDQTGDFATTMLGAGLGFGMAIGVNHLLWPPAKEEQSAGTRLARRAAEIFEVLLPSIGATIAFNSTRRRR
jgi:hypothetical protein